MARGNDQLARALLPLVKQLPRRLGVAGTVGLLVVAALYALVLQPIAAQRFGLPLPSLIELVGVDAPAANQRPAKKPQAEPQATTESDLAGVLTDEGRSGYRSEAGLRYTRGSQHGTRLAHLLAHTRDEPDRVGSHGVFDATDPAEVVRLVDEAYRRGRAGDAVEVEREGERTVYTVDFGRRIGYQGGQTGARRGNPPAEHLKLVVEGDRFITAYPLRL